MFWRRRLEESLANVETDLAQTRKWVVQLEADLRAERVARVDAEKVFHASLAAHLEHIRLLRDTLTKVDRRLDELESRAVRDAGRPSPRSEFSALLRSCADSLDGPPKR